MPESTDSRHFPAVSEGDKVHASLRAILSLVPGGNVWTELFSFLVRAPYQKRMEEWMREVEMRLRHLADRDKTLYATLANDEFFTSIFIASSQAAARTHQSEKRKLLASGVVYAAGQRSIDPDLQLIFVRFIDELTVLHISFLRFLYHSSDDVPKLNSYSNLREIFEAHSRVVCSADEFRLLCNDLSVRALCRFSTDLREVAGLSGRSSIVARQINEGKSYLVTDVGKSLLEFVKSDASEQAI